VRIALGLRIASESQASGYSYSCRGFVSSGYGFDPSGNLSEEQQGVIRSVFALLEDPLYDNFALHGAAGTGKTFTCGHLAWQILEKFGSHSILFISPTHAAARILRSKLPKGPKVLTVASFVRSQAFRVFDKTKFSLPNVDEYKKIVHNLHTYYLDGKDGAPLNLRLVVSDESSMINQDSADCIHKICRYMNAKYLLVGDPYQLPPVMTKEERRLFFEKLGVEDDDPNQAVYAKEMCLQFRKNAVPLRLTEVKRNGGNILRYAANIRENFSNHHCLPDAAQLDAGADSGIFIARSYSDFIHSLAEAILESKTGIDVAAIAYTNKTVQRLTNDVRKLLYPETWMYQYNVGEAVLLPMQTFFAPIVTDDGFVCVKQFSTRQAFYSTTHCVVKKVEIVDLDLNFGSFDYRMPGEKLGNTLEFRMRGKFQKILLKHVHSRLQQHVYCPVLNDNGPKEIYKVLEQKVYKLIDSGIIPGPGEPGHAEHITGEILQCMTAFLPVINSANTMTIHKAQGCTLDKAFIHHDVERCTETWRNNLLYTSLTRASSQQIIFNPCFIDEESVLPLLENGKRLLNLPPSERKPPKLSEQEIDDLFGF